MASQAEVATILAYLSSAISHFKPRADTQAVWYDALNDVDGDLLLAAAREQVRVNSKHKPAISEIRERALEIKRTRASSAPLLVDGRPAATPAQIQQRCREAIEMIDAAAGPDEPRSIKAALKGAVERLRKPADPEDRPW